MTTCTSRGLRAGVAGGVLAMMVVAAGAAMAQPVEGEGGDGHGNRRGGAGGAEIAGFEVREGYRVSVAVESAPGARFLEVDDKGTLYVSRMRMGDILSFRDEDGDGVYEKRAVFVTDKPKVHGMCFSAGYLWFCTDGAIYKGRDTNGDLVADEVVEVIPPGQLPRGGTHLWRSLLVTEDSIYTSIGDGGNISDQTKTDRQKIWRFDLDGSNKRLFASGLRNTEKLRLRPGGAPDELWGFDHGSDNFGQALGDMPGANQPITDLNPPDELNRYVQDGFYGHPFIVGDRIPREEYRDRPDIHQLAAATIPPEWKVGAHWATNGWCFIDPAINQRPAGLPPDTNGDIFVACHGSWNSSRPVGYCIARVLFDKGSPYGLLKIVSTANERTGQILARPVDCVQAADGSVLFSADQPGRIYRITRDRVEGGAAGGKAASNAGSGVGGVGEVGGTAP